VQERVEPLHPGIRAVIYFFKKILAIKNLLPVSLPIRKVFLLFQNYPRPFAPVSDARGQQPLAAYLAGDITVN
jgi:hypothetical protein